MLYIQELLGHNSSKTTEIHTHVSTKNIQQLKVIWLNYKKHILTKSGISSHLHLLYIQLAKESIEYKVELGEKLAVNYGR